MDTFTAYKLSKGNEWIIPFLEKKKYFNFNNNPELVRWMKLSRFIVELHQLFEIYLWNYSQLANGLYLNVDGRINRILDNGTNQSQLIRVNGYVMNCVSSAVNFLKSVEKYCKHEARAGKKAIFSFAAEFLEFLHAKFYGDLHYALAYVLRNYSQHGQLIISIHNDDGEHNRVCLDMFQLLNAELVSINDDTREKLEYIYDSLRDIEEGPIRLFLAQFLSSLHLNVCSLYEDFLSRLDPYVLESKERVETLLEESHEKILSTSDLPYFIILLEENHDRDIAHFIIEPPDKSVALLQHMKKEAGEKLLDAKEKLNMTNQCFKHVVCSPESL